MKENKIRQRNEIISKLENKTNLTEDEATRLENELSSIIIELARMK
jgi:hypothetical protein